jgi:hypothetical protein
MFRLTSFGFMLVARYRMIEHTVESAVREELRGLWADIDAPSDDYHAGGNKKPRQIGMAGQLRSD